MDARPDGTRLSRSRWSIAIVTATLLAIMAAYRWNRERKWTLRGGDGHSLCRVQAGWTEREVVLHCGVPSGRGRQPKVPAYSGSLVQMCSAPGDVYGTKAVLYGCDGKVEAVETMPAQGLIYPWQ